MIALDLITGSLRLIGVVASGESLPANESTDGLTALNALLDSWSNEELLIPNKVRESFALTPSTGAYTMGTGGNFNTPRAQRIENALIQFAGTSPLLELPVDILTKEQFQGILIKQLTSTYPRALYPDGAYPLETINLWPVPTAACNLILYSWKPLTTIATINTAISLPPGYERALKYALAVELAPEYGKPVPAIVEQIAMDSKAVLKRKNAKPSYLQVDDALRSRPAVRNWRTGDPQ